MTPPIPALKSDFKEAIQRLDQEVDGMRRAAQGDIRGRNVTLIAQKLAGLELHHANRLRQLDDRVQKTSDPEYFA